MAQAADAPADAEARKVGSRRRPDAASNVRMVLVNRLALIAVLCCGCIQSAPGPLPPVPPPDENTSTSALVLGEVSAAIARRIDAGQFRDSDELLKTLEKLVDAKELAQADADRIVAACEGIKAKSRALTAADADAVRGVK